MRLRLLMLVKKDRLAHIFCEDLIQNIVGCNRQTAFSLQQLLYQQRVQIVGIHHIIFSPEKDLD